MQKPTRPTNESPHDQNRPAFAEHRRLLVRDEGVAGSNPATSTSFFSGLFRDGALYRERNRPLSALESFIGDQNDTADNDQNYSCKFREGELFTEQKSDNHSGFNSPSNTDGSAN